MDCLQARGFNAKVYEGVGVMLPAEQLEAAEEAGGQCWQEVDARFPGAPELSKEQEYYLHLETAECLRAQGYDIPEAPTLETWLETYEDPDGPWLPYLYVPQDPDTFWALVEICPQPGMR